jgi:hypothetical protein
LTINRAVGFVEILVYCRIGQSAIFGVVLTLINTLFISLLLQIRERLHHAISRRYISVIGGIIDGIIRLDHWIIRPNHGTIRLNYDYPHWPGPIYILSVSRDLRDAGKKDDCRE